MTNTGEIVCSRQFEETETEVSLVKIKFKPRIQKKTKLYIGHYAPISTIKLLSFPAKIQYKLVLAKKFNKKVYYSKLIEGYQTFTIAYDETSYYSRLFGAINTTGLPWINGDEDAYIESVTNGYHIYDEQTDMFLADEYVVEFNGNHKLKLYPNHRFDIEQQYTPITNLEINKNIQSTMQNDVCRFVPNDGQNYVFDNTLSLHYPNYVSGLYPTMIAYKLHNNHERFDSYVKTMLPEYAKMVNDSSMFFNPETSVPDLSSLFLNNRNEFNIMTITFDNSVPSSELKDIEITSYYYNIRTQKDHEGRIIDEIAFAVFST